MSFKIKYNLFFLILIVVSLFFYRYLLADQGKDVIAERVKNMQKSDQSMVLIKRSIISSDYKEVVENARFIRDWAARMKMYFPLGSGASIYNSSAASNYIWNDIKSFNSYVKSNKDNANSMMVAAQNSDKQKLIVAFEETSKSCINCHNKFRN